MSEGLSWYFSADPWDSALGEDGAVTRAQVMYCDEGGAEGGLVKFARLYGAVLGVDTTQATPLTPAGWFYAAQVEPGGHWCSAQGPYETRGEAITACDEHWKRARAKQEKE
jgi:hypothetical protein